MALTDADRARFLVYAGGVLERAEVLLEADSAIELARHIDEFEQSKRGGGDDVAILTNGFGPRPSPKLGSAENPSDSAI